LNNALEQSHQSGISSFDIAATLCAFSASAIIQSIEKILQGRNNFKIYASGGGIYNPLIMQHLKKTFWRKTCFNIYTFS